MDLQEIFNNAMAAKRAESMKNSSQLTLGELIMKMEAVKNKTLPVFYDEEKWFPTSIDSWRGSYCELALDYEEQGDKKSAEEILAILKEAKGKTYTGYKGGDFLMGKTTPVWVANYGNSSGFKENEEIHCQAITDVEEKEDRVIIHSELKDY